jgi:catechol 2,3-dioxygenase-like lactoylglutathione lyase family enzyme
MAQTLERPTDEQVELKSPVRVKKLGHVVYRVRDIDRSVKFYTEILNFRVSDVNENGMVFLNACGDHHTIGLAQAAAGEAAQQPDRSQLGLGHFAMEVSSLDELFEIREFLKAKGVKIVGEGRKGPGCNIGVELHDPDGYTVELYCNMDQIGPNNRSRPADQWRRAKTLEEARDNPLSVTW